MVDEHHKAHWLHMYSMMLVLYCMYPCAVDVTYVLLTYRILWTFMQGIYESIVDSSFSCQSSKRSWREGGTYQVKQPSTSVQTNRNPVVLWVSDTN